MENLVEFRCTRSPWHCEEIKKGLGQQHGDSELVRKVAVVTVFGRFYGITVVVTGLCHSNASNRASSRPVVRHRCN